jgi:serine/threonine protein kinase
MTPEEYSRVKQLFFAVQEMESENRPAFLAENCDGDEELQNAVLALLASSAKVEGFIERAAYEVLSETLVADVPVVSIAGKRIGAYRVLREINHGGMGTVYLANRDDNTYQKQVAIKIVRGGFDSTEVRRRFYEERKILARLDHPNITKLLDGGTTDDGLPYYVMDYVEGVALNQYCEQNSLSINERLGLFRKVCAAVQYAHRNLVIHRDLKPSNILVTADGTPQLLDFGIAKVFQDEENAAATRTNLPVMTPEYASPEQITGKVITTATDIYSLGIILHELLTGSRPFHFKSNSLEEIIHFVCETEPTKPSQSIANGRSRSAGSKTDVARDGKDQGSKTKDQKTTPPSPIRNPQLLKGDLDNIVLKALRKEPERRYATVEQFAEDIRRHQVGLPVIARADTFLYRSSKFIKRNRIGVTVTAGVFVLLIIGAIAIVRQTRIAEREARVAAEQRNRAVREQAKAERINKFFQEMLAFANPNWYAPGYNKPRDLTIIQALDEAARKIENDLNEEPEVKAEILMTIGDTYASLERFEQSERALESAVKLRREVYGEDNVKVADAFYLLANTKRILRKHEEMMKLYEQAYPIYRRHAEEESQYPYFLIDYANSFSDKGNHAENVRLCAEAVEMLRRLKGGNHAAIAVARMNLAVAYYRWGDMDNALAEGQAAYEMIKPATSLTVFRLGQIHLARGDLEKAEPLLLEAASRLEQEGNSIWQSNALGQLAHLYQAQNNHQKAEDFITRAIAIDRRHYASNHYSLLGDLINQGLILTRAGRPKQGEAVMRVALNQMNDEQRKSFAGDLGECLLAQHRYAEAEPLLLDRYRVLKETQHPTSPFLKTAHEQLQTITNFKLRITN